MYMNVFTGRRAPPKIKDLRKISMLPIWLL